MLTTPDDPLSALPKLRTRASAVQGLLTGYYKLAGDRVTTVFKFEDFLAPCLWTLVLQEIFCIAIFDRYHDN